MDKEGVNPHFKSKFVTLDGLLQVVLPLASEAGITITNTIDDAGRLVTTITDIETGEAVSSFFPIATTDPQKIGATITYARRYNLGSIFNVVTEEDDDGNKASGVGEERQEKKDEKPWMNEPQFKALESNIEKYASAEEAIRVARSKYAVSKVMAERIKKLFESDEDFSDQPF